jgi:hypothetical protein
MFRYLWSFLLGVNVALISLNLHLAPEGISLYNMGGIPELVEECQKELPRTETCVLIAVPKTIERL